MCLIVKNLLRGVANCSVTATRKGINLKNARIIKLTNRIVAPLFKFYVNNVLAAIIPLAIEHTVYTAPIGYFVLERNNNIIRNLTQFQKVSDTGCITLPRTYFAVTTSNVIQTCTFAHFRNEAIQNNVLNKDIFRGTICYSTHTLYNSLYLVALPFAFSTGYF